MTPAIKIKLKPAEVTELTKLYSYFIHRFDRGHDWHHALLWQHMYEQYHRVHALVPGATAALQAKSKKALTLKLSELESLAFYQLWQLIDTSAFVFGTALVCRIIKDIDRAHKQTRIVYSQTIQV